MLALAERDSWSGSVITTVPSAFEELLDRGSAITADTVVIGGEPLTPDLVRRTRQAVPGIRVVNGYGPTETYYVSAHPVGETLPDGGSVPIGAPLANTRFYVLDPWLRPVPEGVEGEESVAALMHAGDEQILDAIDGYQRGFTWLRDPRFVTIAQVHGHAIGAGFQLALACDLRVVADDATFCMKEPALGLVPDLTGTKPLVELVGHSRALEICATARFVSADEASRMMGNGLPNLTRRLGDVSNAGSGAASALGPSGGGLGGSMMGVAAAPLSTLAFFYMLEWLPPAKKMSIGICFGMVGSSLALPLARVMSPSLMQIGEWHGLYLMEVGLALVALAVIFLVPITHPPRQKSFDKDDLIKIVELETEKFAKRLNERKITLEFTPEAKTLLIEKGYDEKYGARPLRRAIEQYLEDPLAEALLRGDVKDGEPCLVERDGDKLIFKQKTPPATTEVAS